MVEVITGWHLNESVRGRFADWTHSLTHTLTLCRQRAVRYDWLGFDWIIAKRSNCSVHQIAFFGDTSRPPQRNLRRRVDIDSLSRTRTTRVELRLKLSLRLRARRVPSRRFALARHVCRCRQHFFNKPQSKQKMRKECQIKLPIFGYDIPYNRFDGKL